jgi:hypothetical protein
MRRITNDTHAGIATYVFILFGLSFMLYLFGFTNMWDAYLQANITGNGSSIAITDEGLNLGINLLFMIANSIYSLLVLGVSVGIIAILLVFFRSNTTIWQYVIPIILLVILNIFIFPVSALSNEFKWVPEGIPISTFLIILFNLFYVLAVIEFIRGGST